ncbi:hypothetical protein H4R34_004219 [Dimargaris verticillata]|uniref:PRELI/MSF1 domain-containing protein n=1 Tax=Dimargaris verticillata TaxID=2761393 RepID=A0A9W8B0Z4_9FUNG|nr:hypothetical protein H4R34_004219 [Dimargaris verticillata]
MVKVYQHTFNYDHPWSLVTVAYWLRYPNPFASHVLSTDVIERTVDPTTGVLHTTRLILKRGLVPRWAQGLMKSNEAYILEESDIDPQTGTMVSVTRNITQKRVAYIEETQTLRRHPDDPERTQVKLEARFLSNLGWGLTSKIEAFCQRRFAKSSTRSRLGMSYILERLRETSKFPAAPWRPAPASSL